MLKVTIEIVPFGIEDHVARRDIATMSIGFQRRQTRHSDVAEYVSTLEVDDKGPQPAHSVIRTTHARQDGAAELVRKCLREHLRISPDSA